MHKAFVSNTSATGLASLSQNPALLAKMPNRMPAYNIAGISLLADATHGPNFLTATSSGLNPGTNYTVLATVRMAGSSASNSQAASPTMVALTGLLVPDTAPPSFTKAAVNAVTPGTGSNGSSTAAGATTFSIQMDIGLSEDGRVYYAVYGDPACITGMCVGWLCNGWLFATPTRIAVAATRAACLKEQQQQSCML